MGKGMPGKGILDCFIPLPHIPLPPFGSIDNIVSIFRPETPTRTAANNMGLAAVSAKQTDSILRLPRIETPREMV
jgi:hypothetical protein